MKLLLTIALLAAAFTVRAEWAFVAESVSSNKTFIETKYQVKSGGGITVWRKSNDTDGTSTRIRVTYNCRDFTSHTVSTQTFSSPDFEGSDITDLGLKFREMLSLAEGILIPLPVPPETVESTALDYACNGGWPESAAGLVSLGYSLTNTANEYENRVLLSCIVIMNIVACKSIDPNEHIRTT